MESADRQRKVNEILRSLNAERIRATYGAVGDLIGIPAISVSQYLGERRPKASWVVNDDTGQPTGYTSDEMHPDLRRTANIIRSGDALDALLQQHPE